jgi:hypothetical protein
MKTNLPLNWLEENVHVNWMKIFGASERQFVREHLTSRSGVGQCRAKFPSLAWIHCAIVFICIDGLLFHVSVWLILRRDRQFPVSTVIHCRMEEVY